MYKNLRSLRISISLANFLRAITILFYPDYYCHSSKNTFELTSKTQASPTTYSEKQNSLAEFCLLFLDSLKYNSKAKLPINRSALTVTSRNLTTIWDHYLFFVFVYLLYTVFKISLMLVKDFLEQLYLLLQWNPPACFHR